MNSLIVKYQPSIRSWRLCAVYRHTADSVVDGGCRQVPLKVTVRGCKYGNPYSPSGRADVVHGTRGSTPRADGNAQAFPEVCRA